MTSKERVKASFAHKQPDKMAVDFGGFSCSQANVLVVDALREYYGLSKEPVKVLDMSTMTGIMDPDLKDILGSDVQLMDPKYDSFGHRNDNWKEWTYHGKTVLIPGNCTIDDDGNGGYYVYPMGDSSVAASGHMPSGGFYFDNIMRGAEFDEDEANPEDQIEECQIITDEDLSYYRNIVDNYKESDRAFVISPGYYALGDAANIPGPNVKEPKGIRSLEEWYITPLLYPDYVHEAFAAEAERAVKSFERIYDVLGNDIDVMYICGTDFGTQRGPFVNPEVFKEFYLPYYKKMNDWIHEHTEWKTLKHTCGGIFPILPLLIESGFDSVNPVQCSAAGMDPQSLKDTYGKDILFWGGGVDTQKVLPFGTPEEVKEQVKQRCEIFSKDGGFIFNTIHIIQANTPVENIAAMIDAVKEFNGDK